MTNKRFGFAQMYFTQKIEIPENEFSFVEKKIIMLLDNVDLETVIPIGWEMLVYLCPSDYVDQVKLMGPDSDRSNKYISYAIHFPAASIVKSEISSKTFMELFFEALAPFSGKILKLRQIN